MNGKEYLAKLENQDYVGEEHTVNKGIEQLLEDIEKIEENTNDLQ